MPGTNDLVTPEDAASAIASAARGGELRAVVCQLEVPIATTVAALQAAKAVSATGAASVYTFFSPAPAPSSPDDLPFALWAACDVALPNAIEAAQVRTFRVEIV